MTARTSQDLELALGIVEAITPVKSPGDLATLLDTPGLPATFLLAKERTPSRSESHLGTAKASTPRSSKSAATLVKSPNTSALDSLLDTPGLPDTLLGTRTPNRQPLGLLNSPR